MEIVLNTRILVLRFHLSAFFSFFFFFTFFLSPDSACCFVTCNFLFFSYDCSEQQASVLLCNDMMTKTRLAGQNTAAFLT